VERDGVVGFKQLCTIFPPHIWRLCDLHIFNKMPLVECCMYCIGVAARPRSKMAAPGSRGRR